MGEMKKLDLVRLRNEVPYKKFNLEKDMRGIIVKVNSSNSLVMFFNPQNIGEYAIVDINNYDIVTEKEQLPSKFYDELLFNLDSIMKRAGDKIEPLDIKPYVQVVLLVEDDKYTRYGIHKGDTGCVMDSKAIKNYIEVDFSGVDENGESYGDCILVKLDDLKIIE